MAEKTRPGAALRIYQILFVLAVGWMVGRLPNLLAEEQAVEARLISALGSAPLSAGETDSVAPLAAAPARLEGMAAAELAATVAAQVASQVAQETISRMIEAGWRPAGMIAASGQQPAPVPMQSIIRVIHEQPPAASGWSLPPSAPSENRLALADEQVPTQFAPAGSQPRPAPPPRTAQANPAAYGAATQGYSALAAGRKREAASLFAKALMLDSQAAQADSWRAELRQLTKRWNVAAYTLARDGGFGDPLAASPVLGGGQSGGAISYTLDPLARRPISIVARVAAASLPSGGLDRDTAEGAIGVRFNPLVNVPVAIDLERRVALGPLARSDWALRLSGGTAGHIGNLPGRPSYDVYGEAGVVGLDGSDIYGGIQGRSGIPVAVLGKVETDVGAGFWAAGQASQWGSVGRLDVGPSARFRIRPWPFTAQLDYRWRMAGTALPGSGPVLTVQGQF